MSYTNRLTWETLRFLDAGGVPFRTGTYTALGTPLANPSYICKLVNNSTVLITISIDGVTDIDVAPANSFWLYDESKAGIASQSPALPVGTQIYVKGGTGFAAATGGIYLVTQYIIAA